jgi:hypothetical protein
MTLGTEKSPTKIARSKSIFSSGEDVLNVLIWKFFRNGSYIEKQMWLRHVGLWNFFVCERLKIIS